MKKWKTAAAVFLSAVMVFCLAACGNSAETSSSASEAGATGSAAAESDIVNIGFSDTLTSMNPLNMPMAFVDLYANSLQFLPLVAFNPDYSVEGMLAESITTEDNLTFHVKLRDDAAWSDGEPVTADDVIFTILRLSSPEVANPYFNFSRFKGFTDGTSPSGATEIEGLQKIDDKNLEFIANEPMSLDSFYNSIAAWICILPKHVLEEIPASELAGNDWFSHPTVVSGPYRMDSYDLLHYVSYTANENYFLGAPKIKKLNIRIVDGSQLLANLESGELDMVHPSSLIPSQDQEKAEAADNLTVTYSDNIISQMTLINTASIPDARVRRAIVYAIDREALVENILQGHGEVTDSFICSASPYYNPDKGTNAYDPEKAKELLSEAGWDSSRELEWNVNAGDENAKLAAQVAQQQLAEVGIKVNINTLDFATLQASAGTEGADLTSVQYTITPTDYYADAQWLVDDFSGSGSWTGGFYDEALDEAIQGTQTALTQEELQSSYDRMEEIMLEQVPLFPLYFQSNPGVVNNRIKNAEMTFFGAFNHVQDWEIQS